jgi:DNA-binding GntR family transcriptional regulator
LIFLALAPFINQLRDLHHLFNDIEKKIEKRLLILKIKSNEQKEFLQTISEILHGNEKFHLTINKLNQNEYQIEIQEKEIEHLSSIIFRYEYSPSCLE